MKVVLKTGCYRDFHIRLPEKYFGILNSEVQPQGIAPKVLANLIIWNSIYEPVDLVDFSKNHHNMMCFLIASKSLYCGKIKYVNT
ncbi:hypothetical protein MTBBW1_2130034 [Desulfamplus magnetovallimortis]|uniref:Uncharacterized protein n=1 Tax=Desulfamplus magnetovallimortis TaxID=1246637 RepID=A0A1W1HCF8_9BACT|nr:hypothetical protein MTBBW1_2130034 [Desulfamplus magnetovallimortis]